MLKLVVDTNIIISAMINNGTDENFIYEVAKKEGIVLI